MARPKASTSKAVTSADNQTSSSQSAGAAKTRRTSAAAAKVKEAAVKKISDEDEEMSSGTKQKNSRARTNGSSSKAAPKTEDIEGDDMKPAVKSTRKRKAKVSSSEELTDLDDLEKGDEVNPKKSKGKGKAKAPRKPRKYKGLALEPYAYPERKLESRKFIGAHVSIAESVAYAPHRALVLGGKAFGLFLNTQKIQKTWTSKPLDEEAIRLFKLRCTGQTETIPDSEGTSKTVEHGDGRGFDPLKHLVPHGSYLTNLCNPDKAKRDKSYDNFLDELKRAEALGIGLFNFHPGSTVGGCTREESYAHIADCINRAHEATNSVVVLLENMAGKNNIIGYQFEDLAAIIKLVNDKTRIGVCFDTCHAFAAGYDLRTPEAYAATFQKFDEIVGLSYLLAIHANDSKADFESHRDLHSNIGAGKLGLGAFHNFMRDPRFDDIPFILETPMLSGSLQVTVKTPQSSKSTTTNGSGAIKTEVKVETDDIQLFDEEKADNDTPEGNLTIGATTWKREIQLLHALELVPVGETSEEIERLQAEIMAIVTQYRKKEEAIAQAKKTAKEAAKAEKEQQNERDGKGKKGKGRKKAKIEPKEEEEEEEEMGRQDSDEEACASHGENDE